MSKGLKEAKATDMFNRAASGLGSSFYGPKEKNQKKTKKRVYRTKQQKQVNQPTNNNTQQQATNQTQAQAQAQATNQTPAKQQPANPPTQTAQKNTPQQKNINYTDLYNDIKDLDIKTNNQELAKFFDVIYRFCSDLKNTFEPGYQKFYNEHVQPKLNAATNDKEKNIVVDAQYYATAEIMRQFLENNGTVIRGFNMTLAFAFNKFLNIKEENIRDQEYHKKVLEVFKVIEQKVNKAQQPAAPKQTTTQNPVAQLNNDYDDLYNKLKPYKNLNNFNNVQYFNIILINFFKQHDNNYEYKYNDIYQEYNNKRTEYEKINNIDGDDIAIIYYALFVVFTKVYINSGLEEAYKATIKDIDNYFKYIQRSDNKDKQISNQMKDFITEKSTDILDIIEIKVGNQSKTNQIDESLIRRWKVLANIK